MKRLSRLTGAASILCSVVLIASAIPAFTVNAATADEEAVSGQNVLNVDPIKEYNLIISGIDGYVYEVPSVEYTRYPCLISKKGQTVRFSYTAKKDCEYQLALTEKSYDDLEVSVKIKDDSGELHLGSDFTQSGMVYFWNAVKGKTYDIEITQEKYYGRFFLIIGEVKKKTDILDYTKIKDSAAYLNQTNYYTFEPLGDDEYSFTLADIEDDSLYRIALIDPSGMTYTTSVDNSNGFGLRYVELHKDRRYTIEVTNYTGTGSYSLCMDRRLDVTDISEYTQVDDSFHYYGQSNTYSFTPKRDGIYSFEYSEIDKGVGGVISFEDEDGSDVPILDSLGLANTRLLKKGKKYTIKVSLSPTHDPGAYSIKIGQPKETLDISDYDTVKDSIQYVGQRNTYTIKASRDGKYSFKLAETADSMHMLLTVKDSAGKVLSSKSCKAGEVVSSDLSKNVTYTVEVKQEEGLGSYTLSVERPAPQVTTAPTAVPTAVTPKPIAVPTGMEAKPTPADNVSDIRKFVDRIYTFVLGREPEEEGASFWTKELYEFKRSGAEVAQGFIFSDEFVNRKTSDKDFIEILYKTFFDRDPEQDGMDFWSAQLSSGAMSREDVANGFIFSQEWADTCAKYGIRSGGMTQPTISIEPTELTYAFVERMYTTAMKRASDEEGAKFWANELSNFRFTGEQVGVMFFLSDEMNGFGLDNKEFVTRLYKTFMNRDPEEGGFNFWVGYLNDGGSREGAVLGFTRSEEFVNKCIEARILPY